MVAAILSHFQGKENPNSLIDDMFKDITSIKVYGFSFPLEWIKKYTVYELNAVII